MPTSNYPMNLSHVLYNMSHGAWQQTDGGDFYLGEGVMSLVYEGGWCQVHRSRGCKIVLQVILLSDEDSEPWTGMYKHYTSQEVYEIRQPTAQVLADLHHSKKFWNAHTDAERLTEHFDHYGEGFPTHHWPEGYATLEDLLAACSIPRECVTFLALPKP